MKTYQDFEKAVEAGEQKKQDFIVALIKEHQASPEYRIACKADDYYHQKTDIVNYKKFIYDALGRKHEDVFSANNKLPSNWYFKFTTQAIQFLLGRGVNFKNPDTAAKLGDDFLEELQEVALYAKNGGAGYLMWDKDHTVGFSFTEFVPLYDERTSQLKAGVRYWQIENDKPIYIDLYEIDGITQYEYAEAKMTILKEKVGYISVVKSTEAEGVIDVSYENYPSLPIVPLYNINRQSDLVGNKETIDAYDLIASGLVNNASNSDFIYWVLKNVGGFDDDQVLQQFVDKINTVRAVSLPEEAEAEPKNIAISTAATEAALAHLKNQLYEDFMALKVEDIAAGNVTATQILAAYEPLNEKTDMFETNVISCVNGILKLAGIDDKPSFPRSMIVNKAEELQNLTLVADLMGKDFAIKKIAAVYGVSEEEANEIIREQEADEADRFKAISQQQQQVNNFGNNGGEGNDGQGASED